MHIFEKRKSPVYDVRKGLYIDVMHALVKILKIFRKKKIKHNFDIVI